MRRADPHRRDDVGAVLLPDDEGREVMRQAALRNVADMTYESLAAWWSDVLAVSW